jgi:Ca-activated chloride channel family protein
MHDVPNPLAQECAMLESSSLFGHIVMRRRTLTHFSSTTASVLALCFLFASHAGSQSPASNPNESAAAKESPGPEHELRLSADTTLVQIPVGVTDAQNRYVLGLHKDDFHLFEDNVEQNVAVFAAEDAPLSIGLVFDESGSMGYKLRNSVAAVNEFMKAMTPDDETFLVEFSETARLSVPFTSLTRPIMDALAHAQIGGLTAMLDAVTIALGEMKHAKNSRKAIVIVSDGGDNHSQYTSLQIESLVRAADVQIYAMGVLDPGLPFGLSQEEISGPKLLSEIATQTGGRAFSAAITADLPSVAARIAVELRNQYVLGYYPKNHARDGNYRRVDLKLTQPRGVSPLKAHWRLGYYAPKE